VRAVLGKIQRKFDQRKAMMARFVDFCWMRVIGWGIENDGLPASPNWWRIAYQFQPKMTIDLGDTMTNERTDVQCAQMTEQERFGNRGLDWEREKAQMFREGRVTLDACMQMYQDYKGQVPLELILARYGFGPQQPFQKQQQQAPGETPTGDNVNSNR
jgi:hypothetical protein